MAEPAAPPPPRPLRAGLLRALRMTLFVLVVLGAGSWLLLARAEARLDRQLLDAGRAMVVSAPGAAPSESAGEMQINGERIHAATTTTPHALAAVLEYVASRCVDGAGPLRDTVVRLRDPAPLPAIDSVPGLRELVLREDDGDQGYVACLDPSRGRGATAGERLAHYRESGDLADLGQLRYLYARDAGNHLELAALWTEGPFRVNRVLWDGEGDAPGEDLPGAARPPASRRTLSFARGDGAGRMAMYAPTGGADRGARERTLRRELGELGWTASRAHDTAQGRRVLIATREARTLTYVIGDESTVVFETR